MSCGAEEWETMTGKRRQRGQSVQRMDPPSNHQGGHVLPWTAHHAHKLCGKHRTVMSQGLQIMWN